MFVIETETVAEKKTHRPRPIECPAGILLACLRSPAVGGEVPRFLEGQAAARHAEGRDAVDNRCEDSIRQLGGSGYLASGRVKARRAQGVVADERVRLVTCASFEAWLHSDSGSPFKRPAGGGGACHLEHLFVGSSDGDPFRRARASRLFIHGRLNDPVTGGPLYCRILSFEGDLVEFEAIYHREDGSERIPKPSRLRLEGFLELVFGRWYEGSSPPPAAPTRPRGQPVPLDPRKVGGRPAGS